MNTHYYLNNPKSLFAFLCKYMEQFCRYSFSYVWSFPEATIPRFGGGFRLTVFAGWDYWSPSKKSADPQLPIEEGLEFYPNFLDSDSLQSLQALALQAATQDLSVPKTSPTRTSFRASWNQGVVLRDGVVMERVEGISEFVAETTENLPKTDTPSHTHTLIKQLRSILPGGTTSRGMLLIRICNFQQIPESLVKSTSSTTTPFHTDLKQYGRDVFGLCLKAGSSLVFSKHNLERGEPPCIQAAIPDREGALLSFNGALRYAPWKHGVFNTSLPRISVTWRPNSIIDSMTNPLLM